MPAHRTFTVTIKYVLNEHGDPVVLPDGEMIAALEEQLAGLETALQKLKAESHEDKNEAAVVAAVLEGQIGAGRAELERMRRLVSDYERTAQSWEFKLHTWSWLEREAATEDAREINPTTGVVRINESQAVLGLLERCIDDWNLDCPVSKDAIAEELPPTAIDRLYKRLQERSEASVDTLPFPGNGAVRPAEGKSRVSGKANLRDKALPVD